MKKLALMFVLFIFFFLFVQPTISKVFMNRDQALKTAFPDADNIEKRQVYLTEAQVQEIEVLGRVKVDSKLYIVYVGWNGDELLGYAVIDTHTLRTKSETVMFVVNTDGTMRYVEILAFFEPPDYFPGDNWLSLLEGKELDDSLRIGHKMPNITGATITANALMDSVRRVMAVIRVSVLRSGSAK